MICISFEIISILIISGVRPDSYAARTKIEFISIQTRLPSHLRMTVAHRISILMRTMSGRLEQSFEILRAAASLPLSLTLNYTFPRDVLKDN